MTREEGAWLLVRFFGLICGLLAVWQTFGLAFGIQNVIEAYRSFSYVTTERDFAMDRYVSAWVMLGESVVVVFATLYVARYAIVRGELFHRWLMR